MKQNQQKKDHAPENKKTKYYVADLMKKSIKRRQKNLDNRTNYTRVEKIGFSFQLPPSPTTLHLAVIAPSVLLNPLSEIHGGALLTPQSNSAASIQPLSAPPPLQK